MTLRRAWFLGLLALVYGGLNAVKPLHIDDGAYAYYSVQAAEHPLDPYGFALLWYDEPQSANTILAPPVVPYGWALARIVFRPFGAQPWLWKLALLPWCALLVWSVYALLRRYAPGVELPVTVMTVLSPALLPSLNFMLDVPALALSLAAVFLFLIACDRNSLVRAALAGLLAGLAMETKYTGGLAPAVMLLAAATTGRWRLWPAAAVAAAQVFFAWEFLMALLYGQSHFLVSAGANAGMIWYKGPLVPMFFSQLGGVTPVLVLLGLAALGWRRCWLLAAGVAVLAGFAAVVLFEGDFTGAVRPSSRLFGPVDFPVSQFQLAVVVFNGFCGAGVVVLALVVRRLLGGDAKTADEAAVDWRATLFLVLWLALEALGFIPLTPFAAVRRVLGPLIVLTLLTARLAARTCQTADRRRVVQFVAGGGVVLGLAFFALDWWEARVEQLGAERAAAFIRAGDDPETIWYVGHWGFQHYAEACGMHPLVVDSYRSEEELTPSQWALFQKSQPKVGDWVVRPDERVSQQNVEFDDPALEEQAPVVLDDPIPLRTVMCYYCGRTAVEHHEGPRLTVRLYRVVGDFQPRKRKRAPP